MRTYLAAAVFLAAISAFAADAVKKIPANSAVYIEPMNGFDTSIQAAILKKGVPLRVVDTKEKADFVLSGTAETQKAGWAKTIFVSPLPSAHAAVVLKDKEGTMVWAYSVDKSNAVKSSQSTAEAIAKHMKNEAVSEVTK